MSLTAEQIVLEILCANSCSVVFFRPNDTINKIRTANVSYC